MHPTLVAHLKFSQTLLAVQSLQILNQLAASWSPWLEPSPVFRQQRLSLSSNPTLSYLQPSTSSISSVKTTSPPTPRRLTTKPRSENASSSHSEKSPERRKLRPHNSVKSLVSQPVKQDLPLVDCRVLSNSLGCLEVAKLKQEEL